MKQWLSKILALALFAAVFSGIAWPRIAAAAYALNPGDIVIDNAEAAYVTKFGSGWSTGTSGNDKYLSNYLTAAPGAPKDHYVDYRPSGAKRLAPGYYDVYLGYKKAGNFSDKVPVEIYTSKDYDVQIISQRNTGGDWKFINTYYFSGDETEYVRISNEGTGTGTSDYVMADAVRFSPNTAVTAPPPANLDANLADLQVDIGTLSPGFKPSKTAYDVSIGQANELAITATVSDSVYASVSIGGAPAVSGQVFRLAVPLPGLTEVPVVVSAVYGSQHKEKTYLLRVDRAYEDDADLKGLSVNLGQLKPDFDKNTVTYEVYAGVEDHSIVITAEASSLNYKSFTIAGEPVLSGQPFTVDLGFELNAIPVVVTAEDGTTIKTYTVNVIRQTKKGDVTGPGNRPDGYYTVADLGFTAYYFGAFAASSDWGDASKADFNGDGMIDEADLAFIASLIE